MSYQRKIIVSLLLASGLTAALPTLAQPGNCGPMGGWERYGEQRNARFEQRQKGLHDALKLTLDQEPAWQKFAASMRGPGKPERVNRADWAQLTAPERADRMLEHARQRQEGMAEHVAALKSFYAVLTPEQKRVFDEQHAGPRAGRRGAPAGAAAPNS